MKWFGLAAAVCVLVCCSFALWNGDDKGVADIEFEKTSHNFGQFPQSEPTQECVFKFRNTGTAALRLNQVITTCGCTVADYSTDDIAPGDSGQISVTYNGLKGYPGYFQKVITVRSNAKHKLVRLCIEGTMTE